MPEQQKIFAGGCRQQNIYFMQTSSEDTHCFTTKERVGKKDYILPQNRAEEALEMQLVSTETQLINVIEGTWHNTIPLRHTHMMLIRKRKHSLLKLNFQLNYVSSLKKKKLVCGREGGLPITSVCT